MVAPQGAFATSPSAQGTLMVRFEQDIKEGKDISINTYLKEEKDYNNKASTIGLKLSQGIEIGFKKSLKLLFKCMEGLVE